MIRLRAGGCRRLAQAILARLCQSSETVTPVVVVNNESVDILTFRNWASERRETRVLLERKPSRRNFSIGQLNRTRLCRQ